MHRHWRAQTYYGDPGDPGDPCTQQSHDFTLLIYVVLLFVAGLVVGRGFWWLVGACELLGALTDIRAINT
jgi:hypothetical protein